MEVYLFTLKSCPLFVLNFNIGLLKSQLISDYVIATKFYFRDL